MRTYSGFSYPEEEAHNVSFSLGESPSEPTCVLKAALDALFCLDAEEISSAFLEEEMVDKLEYLFGLRDGVVNGEASIDSLKLTSEGSA